MNFEPENYSRRALLWLAVCDRYCRLGHCYRRNLGDLHGH